MLRPVYLAVAVTAVWCRYEHSVWFSHRWHHLNVTVPVSEFRLLLLCVQDRAGKLIPTGRTCMARAGEERNIANHKTVPNLEMILLQINKYVALSRKRNI